MGTGKDLTATTPEDQAVTVTASSNVTVTSTTTPSHGTDTPTGPQTIRYTPDTGFVGQDAFMYTGAGPFGPFTANVTVTVTEVPPTARDATIDTTAGKAVGEDLTALTTSAGGNTVTFTVSDPVDGTVTTTTAGSATFTPAAGFTGDGRFSYTVTDNHGGTASAIVTVHVTAATTTTTTATTTPVTTPATTVSTSPVPTTSAPALAFTGTNEAAVGVAGATLMAGGGLLTALARKRRRRHPTWRHLRRS